MFQSIEGFEWVLGLALIFGLALVFTLLIEGDSLLFLGLLCIFNAFAVWGELLPLWSLVCFLVLFIVVIFLRQKNSRSGV